VRVNPPSPSTGEGQGEGETSLPLAPSLQGREYPKEKGTLFRVPFVRPE
jgi:hypothetical protein